MPYFYKAFNLILSCDCPIVHLPKVVASKPDVQVHFGKVDQPIETDKPNYFWAEKNHFVAQIDDVGRFSIQNGSQITIEKAPASTTATLSTFIMGLAMAALLHQRGLLVIHANSVLKNEEVTIFAGASGAGKSSMAAFAMRNGYQLLGDDVCAIYFDENDQPWVLPAYPSIKLWQDGVAFYGQQDKALLQVAADIDKYHIAISDVFCQQPQPLKRMVVLCKTNQSFNIRTVSGIEKFEMVAAQTYRKPYLDMMGLASQHLCLSAKLMKHTTIFQVDYPHDRACQQGLIELISNEQTSGVAV